MPPPPPEEDDWETADFSTLAPTTSLGNSKPSPDLRPTAPAFRPQPQPQGSGVASGSKSRIPQRVFAPPGGVPGGAGFTGNNTADQRADWERRAVSGSRRGQGGAGQGQEGGEVEDEWFRAGQRGQTNRQLWDEANTHATSPTVQIEAPTPLPPPQIKILRRSNQSPSLSGGGGQKASPSPKTYAEKEEEYRLARERIFGKTAAGSSQEGGGGSSPSGSRGSSPQPQPPQSISSPVPHQVRRSPAGSPAGSQNGVLRQPRGPSAGTGFGQGQGNVPYPTPAPGGTSGSAFPPGW